MLLDSSCLDTLCVGFNTVPSEHHNKSFAFLLLARQVHILQDPASGTGIATACYYVPEPFRVGNNLVLRFLVDISGEVDSGNFRY